MSDRSFELADPFDFERLYGMEKYSLQNMLLKEVTMPTTVYGGERTFEVWSDRERHAFWENRFKRTLTSTMNGDAYFAGVTDEDFLEWANAVFSEIEGQPVQLTGACLIRYTNVMSGYPTLRLSGIIATENLERRRYGVTQRAPRPRRVSMYDGMEVDA